MTVIALSATKFIKYQNFLVNGLKDQCIGMNMKEKVRIKTQQTSIDIYLNQTLKELTYCLL